MTWAQAALCWALALALAALVVASGPDDAVRTAPALDGGVPDGGAAAAAAGEPAPAGTAVAETDAAPGYVLDPATLARIEVRRGDSRVVLERAGAGWKVVAPADRTILPGLVQAFVEQLVDSGRGERIGDDPRDPAFGLDAPQLTIDASGAGDGRLRLAIGARTPAGTAAYALVEEDGHEDGRVVLVGLSLLYYAGLLFG